MTSFPYFETFSNIRLRLEFTQKMEVLVKVIFVIILLANFSHDLFNEHEKINDR